MHKEVIAELIKAGEPELANRYAQVMVKAAGPTMFDDVWAGMMTFYKRAANGAQGLITKIDGFASASVKAVDRSGYVAFVIKGGGHEINVDFEFMIGDNHANMRYSSKKNRNWRGTEKLFFDVSRDAMQIANRLRWFVEDYVNHTVL